jgi:hypothetical protein
MPDVSYTESFPGGIVVRLLTVSFETSATPGVFIRYNCKSVWVLATSYHGRKAQPDKPDGFDGERKNSDVVRVTGDVLGPRPVEMNFVRTFR